MATTTVTTRAVKGSALTHTEMDTNFTNLLGATIYVGSIMIWPSVTLPDSKWLELAGQSLATASYPNLFTLIGYNYGGSGVSFNLPDTRGIFVRGFNHGFILDPDAATRLNRGDGTTGDFVGTRQQDELTTHAHLEQINGYDFDSGGPPGTFVSGTPFQDVVRQSSVSTVATGGNETRPKNIQLMYIIKALK